MGWARKSIAVIITALVAMSQGKGDAAAENLAWWFNHAGFGTVGGWIEQHAHFLSPAVVWFLITIAGLCLFWGPIQAGYRYFSKSTTSRRIEIEYQNEANLDHKETAFKISSTPLLSGKPLTHTITSSHEFYIGIENRSLETVRNAGISVLYMSKPPQTIDKWLICKVNSKDRVDILPGRTELFLFMTGQDGSDAVTCH